jgi:hypothetical protein
MRKAGALWFLIYLTALFQMNLMNDIKEIKILTVN